MLTIRLHLTISGCKNKNRLIFAYICPQSDQVPKVRTQIYIYYALAKIDHRITFKLFGVVCSFQGVLYIILMSDRLR